MAMTLGGGDDVSIRVGMETDDAQKKLQGLKTAAESATDTAISGARDATTEIQKLTTAEREAGDAAEMAGEKAADAMREQAAATRDAERATRSSEKAEHDAAAATQVRRMQQGEAAKELTEGLAQAIETYKNTGDAGEASFQFLEKAAMGLTVLNPVAGVAASIGVFLGKAAYEAMGFADAAKLAAENTEKAKNEAETLAQNWTKAWTQAHTTVSEMTSGTAIAESLSKVEKQLTSIGSAAAFVEGEMAKQPPHIREAYAEQLKAIKAEETRLQILQYTLQTRQSDIDIQSRGYELWRAEQDAMKEIAKVREEAHGTAVDQLETEEDFAEFIQERVDLIKEEVREGKNSQEKKQKWIDEIGQAERKLQDSRKKNMEDMERKEREFHEARMKAIKEREEAEIAMRQRIVEAEVAMQQHLIAEQDKAQKQKEGILGGGDAAKAIADEVNRRKNDPREIQKQIMDEAEKVARDRKAADLGLDPSGKEAASNVQVRRAGEAARRAASQDWQAYQRGATEFSPGPGGKPQTREDIEGAIGRAQNEIQDRAMEELKKLGQARRGGLSPQESDLWNQVLKIINAQLNSEGNKSAELSGIQAQLDRIWAEIEARRRADEARGAQHRRRMNGR